MILKKGVKINSSTKLVVEFGSGDGRLLTSISKNEDKENTLYIGVELDKSLHRQACDNLEISNQNLIFINNSFENFINEVIDKSIDKVIVFLPNPKYIDISHKDSWLPMYKLVQKKLKLSGNIILVTEYIDGLLQPVNIDEYERWKIQLGEIFIEMGYKILGIQDGAPWDYSSTFLDKFNNDPLRIKIFTLILGRIG